VIESQRLRVATFNLLHGVPVVGADAASLRPTLDANGRPVGPPPVLDDAALRDSVRRLNADVLGLQEVDVHQPRSGHQHQVQLIAEESGAPWWRFVPAVRGTPGVERDWQPADHTDHRSHDDAVHDEGPRYGIGLVSKLPVLEWHTTVFDAAPWTLPLLIPASPRPRVIRVPDEPRAALAAVIATPTGRLTVATTHLSFVPGYNVRQLRRLRTWLAGMPRPLILMGDFNLPGSLPRRITGFTSLIDAPTYPSNRPRAQLDHIMADGLTRSAVAGVRGETLALPVSDHCALVVDLTLP